jgi:hypothetical protein
MKYLLLSFNEAGNVQRCTELQIPVKYAEPREKARTNIHND